jgi:hypothetical protein
MSEQNPYHELISWLKSRHPQVFTEWESEQRQRQSAIGKERSLLPAGPRNQFGTELDRLSPQSSASAIANAIQQELESLGISGGTPGVNVEGVPCVHLTKKGVYGTAYEESVTLARVRDAGYRRHLRQVFG